MFQQALQVMLMLGALEPQGGRSLGASRTTQKHSCQELFEPLRFGVKTYSF